jgi:hypothetical protein
MTEDLHIRHLKEVWRPEGPLQASLAQALGFLDAEPPPRLKVRQQLGEPLDLAQELRDLQNAIQRGIDKVDVVLGDPDLEEEPDMEEGGDLEAETGA